nr:xylulose kinase-1 [Tanacetum cinerariifolium]
MYALDKALYGLKQAPRAWYVVPTGRLKVPTGRYVVPTGRVIVATGRYVVPAGSNNDSDDASIHNEATNTQQQPNIQPQIITTVSNNNAKFPYLKKDEYKVWAMMMEYWITNNDMNIWKMIQNGKNMKRTGRDHDGRVIILHPTTTEEHIAVQRESKARTTLLQSIPDDHAEDINLKFLRALPSSWSQTLEVDVKGYSTFSSSQSAGLSHSAFVSATSTSKKMSYGDSLNYSSTTTYSVPSNSKTGESDGVIAAKDFGMIAGCDSEDEIKEGAAKLYNLITGANSEEANTASDAGAVELYVPHRETVELYVPHRE